MKRIHRLKLHAVVGAFTLQCFSLLIKYRLTFIMYTVRPPAMNLFIYMQRVLILTKIFSLQLLGGGFLWIGELQNKIGKSLTILLLTRLMKI